MSVLLNVFMHWKVPTKRLIYSIESKQLKYWIMSQLQTFRKNTKIRISCLNFFVVAVWIPICLDMKNLRI